MNLKFQSPIVLPAVLLLASSLAVAQGATHKLTPPRNGQKLGSPSSSPRTRC